MLNNIAIDQMWEDAMKKRAEEKPYEFRRLMKFLSSELGHKFTAKELIESVEVFLEVEGNA